MTARPRPAPSAGAKTAAAGGRPTLDGDREADHAAIGRLADELIPALIAKLSATGLGEIEVGEGDWTIRVRRPAGGVRQDRRGERGPRAAPGSRTAASPPTARPTTAVSPRSRT